MGHRNGTASMRCVRDAARRGPRCLRLPYGLAAALTLLLCGDAAGQSVAGQDRLNATMSQFVRCFSSVMETRSELREAVRLTGSYAADHLDTTETFDRLMVNATEVVATLWARMDSLAVLTIELSDSLHAAGVTVPGLYVGRLPNPCSVTFRDGEVIAWERRGLDGSE